VISPSGTARVYLACGVTNMRRGFDTLTAQVQAMLKFDPHNGSIYVFRGRRGGEQHGVQPGEVKR
jgi:transposase